MSEELKGQIVDKILETVGDRFSGYFPGKWTELGDKFGVSGKTAKSVWQKFVHDGTVSPKKRISGNPPKLNLDTLATAVSLLEKLPFRECQDSTGRSSQTSTFY